MKRKNQNSYEKHILEGSPIHNHEKLPEAYFDGIHAGMAHHKK